MKEEVDRVCGDSKELDKNMINSLDYASCVFKEGIRKWPPVHSVNRYTDKELVIDDYTIPEYTEISVS